MARKRAPFGGDTGRSDCGRRRSVCGLSVTRRSSRSRVTLLAPPPTLARALVRDEEIGRCRLRAKSELLRTLARLREASTTVLHHCESVVLQHLLLCFFCLRSPRFRTSRTRTCAQVSPLDKEGSKRRLLKLTAAFFSRAVARTPPRTRPHYHALDDARTDGRQGSADRRRRRPALGGECVSLSPFPSLARRTAFPALSRR